MNAYTLKCFAIVCMLIDHIGAIFTPGEFNEFRIIGRVAFPIFCFLLVEGFIHTQNIKKYMMRLGLFVLVSELPFDLAFYGGIENSHQNVFFTLFIGMLVIYGISMAEKSSENEPYLRVVMATLIIVLGCFIAILLKTDYDMMGILLIVGFYLFRSNFLFLLMMAFALLYGPTEIYAMFAMILIYFYNGKKGPSMKYFFYVFYPGHLLILYLIWCFKNSINPLQFLNYIQLF